MPQTRTQRQASAQKAAATRKRNAAKRSASSTKSTARSTRSSARQTTRSARQTGRQAARTGRQATRTAERRLDAFGERIEEFGRRAQRALYIQVGMAATARDALANSVRVYTRPSTVVKELDKYERRGARAFGRSERALRRDAHTAQRTVARQTNGVRRDAEDIVDRVKRLA
jgi:hypothetical protein